MALVFSPTEIEAYLFHIGVPDKYLSYRWQSTTKDYAFLATLHTYQICAVPYENLSLHYSLTHSISINPRDTYKKVVANRGRGGYCMETAILWLHILLGVGFNAYPTGVRIRARQNGVPKGDYIGLVHIIIIITFSDKEIYTSDIAFGGDGPTHPKILEHDQDTINLGTQQIRLIYEAIPQFQTAHKFWIYQYRNTDTQPWHSFYCFNLTPFLYEDFHIMSAYTSSPAHFNQNRNVLIVKFLRSDDSINGKIMLVNGAVKRNLGGRTEVIEVVEDEKQRMRAIKKVFGIELTEVERAGIRGWVTELKGL